MRIKSLSNKSVCILGFGREGRAMAEAIMTHAQDAEITVADRNDATDVPKKYWAQLGTGWLENLEKFDVLIKSPGIPFLPEFEPHRQKITSSTQIFLDTIHGSGARIVGVTGSKGKSTTSSLIHAILQEAGMHSLLVGNIGEPAIAHLDDAKSNTTFVHEMSSYQLMNLTSSPEIAVITAFFPEHLDYHGSVLAYLEAKKNITRFQTKESAVIWNSLSPEAKEIAALSAGKKIPFDAGDAPVTLKDIRLKGGHNLGNIAAAWKTAELLGVQKADAIRAIKAFAGLPHRLQDLGVHHGLRWVNDSISTTPESAAAALEAWGKDVETLIAGGQDRGYDFTPLANTIRSSGVKTVILLPDSGILIGKAIERAGAPVLLTEAKTMEDAVSAARERTPEGKTVLLSPAAPSYGHFTNFEERGREFERCIKR